MSSEDKVRTEFERCTNLPDGVSWNEESKSYVGPNFWIADYGLGVWRASRAALCVELPDDPNEEFSDRASAIDACRAAIESQGVRTK